VDAFEVVRLGPSAEDGGLDTGWGHTAVVPASVGISWNVDDFSRVRASEYHRLVGMVPAHMRSRSLILWSSAENDIELGALRLLAHWNVQIE
jgi:hypothetical protein